MFPPPLLQSANSLPLPYCRPLNYWLGVWPFIGLCLSESDQLFAETITLDSMVVSEYYIPQWTPRLNCR